MKQKIFLFEIAIYSIIERDMPCRTRIKFELNHAQFESAKQNSFILNLNALKTYYAWKVRKTSWL